MRKVAIVGVMAMLASLLLVVPALASHPQQIIPGGTSIFEIDTDANLVVDDDGNDDWASIDQGTDPGTEVRKTDTASGPTDESFTQGTKEDTAAPVIETGSIPPNKSDLLTFGSYLETTAAGDKYLNIFWHRVQEPQGTTNMDFEFNKSSLLSTNNVTPVRTAGDVLIQYDLSQGGVNPTLWISRWVTTGANSQCEGSGSKVPCWSDKVNLTAAGDAVGSINTSAIDAADSDGLGNISPRTFGEAQIDFDALSGGEDECVSFGSAYLKSRSSDSFTSALKDFIPPLTLNFDNCGDLTILKTDDGDPATALEGAEFDVLLDNDPFGGSPGAEDTFVDDCITDASGECNFTDLPAGDYWVVETVAPTGYDLPNPAFQLVTVTADATEPVTVTFVDVPQEGAIQITKTEKHAAATGGSRPGAGVTFTIEGGNLPDGGTDVVTGADGIACLDGLAFSAENQTYTVTETEKENYNAVGDGVETVAVDNKAACDDDPYVGETLTFDNVPLTDVTVSVDSLVVGGTDSEISCDTTPATTGSTDDVTGDGSVTVSDLEPTAPDVTLTCIITIDP
jgi:Prealbumin-like fold domain